MKALFISLTLLASCNLAMSQNAPNGPALAGKYGCLICHNVDNKVVGPAFKAVAEKYRGQDAATNLVQKVINGGAGQWGRVPMPPHPNVPPEEVKSIVNWILGLPA
jgi:cytochrome c